MKNNTPVWSSRSSQSGASRVGFQESWYLKLNDSEGQDAFWLRFNVLLSKNGFRRVAEVWAVVFRREENREIQKVALKQSHNIKSFSSTDEEGKTVIHVGDCELGDGFTRGSIITKGKSLKWDLRFAPAQNVSFDLFPKSMIRSKFLKTQIKTVAEDLRFDGTTELTTDTETKTQTWENAFGMQAHLAGSQSPYSWVWGHCNSFVNEQKQFVPFVFEGLSVKARVAGKIHSPRLSSFYFLYQGKEYEFNKLWDTIRTRSRQTLTEWEFQAERGDFSFRGHAKAEHRDFAGMTFEDTDGSLLYSASSQLSNMTIWVYRRGKLETTLRSNGTTALELVSRRKNPYVPLLM